MRDSDTINESISRELGSFVSSKSSTFACGGTIPVKSADVTGSHTAPVSAPIALRWDSPESSSGLSKLEFPIQEGDVSVGGSLTKLVHDCQPASFGYKGKDVLDESYRKATKLDRSSFAVDFCPYELGIVDVIAQVLLPDAAGNNGPHGVKAELYKLNIYEAPSGFFKAHVDTPRAETQFGSLVVSLPSYHEGGQLVVRHAGNSKIFDWGVSQSNHVSASSIQWAAFYSDCEHEVLEVTKGHRVTLTYNLYFSLGRDDLAGDSPAMDAQSLPLYQKVKDAIDEPNFMHDGGYLGIWCQHAYAHSTNEGANALPAILKGSDMAVYSVFLALGLETTVRPVLHHNEKALQDLEVPHMWHEGCNIQEVDPAANKFPRSFVRDYFGEIVKTEVGVGDGYDHGETIKSFGAHQLNVNWLTTLNEQNRSLAMVQLTYGNDVGLDYLYTSAALIIKVPAASYRAGIKMEDMA